MYEVQYHHQEGSKKYELSQNKMPHPTFKTRFRERFPNRIAEVINDFGSTVKSDIEDFFQSELTRIREEIAAEICKIVVSTDWKNDSSKGVDALSNLALLKDNE